MKLASLLVGSLMLAVPALAFEQSAIQTLRVATAGAGAYHTKFPQAVSEGPEAAISNINSATARAADEAKAAMNGLTVQSQSVSAQCSQLQFIWRANVDSGPEQRAVSSVGRCLEGRKLDLISYFGSPI